MTGCTPPRRRAILRLGVKPIRALVAAAILVAMSLPHPSQAAAAAVTVLGSAVKVRPSEHPTGTPAAAIFAARNEFESFQVVVEAG